MLLKACQELRVDAAEIAKQLNVGDFADFFPKDPPPNITEPLARQTHIIKNLMTLCMVHNDLSKTAATYLKLQSPTLEVLDNDVYTPEDNGPDGGQDQRL